MIQSVLLFLVLVVVLGMGGKLLRWMRLPEKRGQGGRAVEQAARCPVCRNFVVGRQPGACDRADCPHRG